MIYNFNCLVNGNSFILPAELRRAETLSGADQTFSVQKRFKLRSVIVTNDLKSKNNK
jgi:hypothetical protein